MMQSNDHFRRHASKLLKAAIGLVAVGLLLVLLFLIAGFQSWSVGLGIFLGMPLLALGMILYIVSVILDLRKHGVFGSSPEKRTRETRH